MENKIEFKAWDPNEKVMLVPNPISSFSGCDSSDGQKNRSDRKSIMTWSGANYNDGVLLNLIMLQYTGLKTGPSQPTKIFNSDLLKYKDKVWKVEYEEDCAGYVILRTELEFGENKRIKLDCDVATESDHYGSFYLNSDIVEVEKSKFLEETGDKK